MIRRAPRRVACRLPADTDDKLEVIAHEVGFYDAAHMSRLFQHILGCWAGVYRDRLRSGSGAPQTSAARYKKRPAIH